MEENRKKVLLIVNPCAGREKSRAGTFDIVESFSQNDYKFSIHTTKCQGDATRIVKEHLKDKDMVVCCGGDGTLNETINGVMATSRRVPIGYIPAGTTNDLASTIGIPKGIKEATNLIMGGNLNDYDLGLFNNRYFSYIASFGTFSKSSYATSQKMKNHLGHLAYVLYGATDIVNIHPYKMRLEHDNGVINGEFVFGTISNSTSVGGVFKLDENTIKLNDGYFEVMLIRKIKYSKIPGTFFKVRKQEYDQQQVLMFKTKKLKITSEEMIDWTLDGEYGGKHNNIVMHVLERAIEIYSGDSHLFLKKRKFADEAYEDEYTYAKKAKKEKKDKREKKEKIKKVEKVYENIKNTVVEKLTDIDEEIREEVEEISKDIKEEIADIKQHIVGNDDKN